MVDKDERDLDRREFLRSAALGAAVGGGYLASGGIADLFASPPAISPSRWIGGAETIQGRPFEMLVLGDSIMWGQGLKDEQKFSYRVEQWIRGKLPGVEVNRRVLAHSGARIEPDAAKDAKPPTHGEVPNHFPSITAQLRKAKTPTLHHALPFDVHPFDVQNVSLVLLDGGINDFGSKVIVNPDPTIGRAWVREMTRRECVDRMKALLPDVAVAFPNAKIVITNYFQIVSEQSDMVYLWELLRFWDIVGGAINWMSEPLRQKMSDQSLAFHQASTLGFREAVDETTRRLLASAKPTPPIGTASLEIAPPPSGRVALAEIPFGPQNAYGAPQTYLFYVNEPDPAASVRKPECVKPVPHPSLELPNCLLAATGHPNVKGARVYADAIIGVLQNFVPEWQAKYGVSSKPTPAGERDPIVRVQGGVSRPKPR